MCPNIEKFVPTRWWWRSRRMLRPVGSSILRSASTHSSLYQRCYFMSVICSKILWQIITINNCFSKDRSQSRVLDVVRSVTGAFNRSQFKLNRSLKTFSLAAWTLNNLSVQTQQKLENFLTCSLNKFSPPLFSGLRLSQELPLGSCCNIRRCLELFLQKWRWLSEIKITFNFFGKRPWSSKIQNHISTDGVSSFF